MQAIKHILVAAVVVVILVPVGAMAVVGAGVAAGVPRREHGQDLGPGGVHVRDRPQHAAVSEGVADRAREFA